MTNALFRLAFAMAPTFNLPLLISRRLILQQARSQTLSRPPTACKLIVSCSISLPLRGSFHLSLTVLCAIGRKVIFSLGRWSSQIPTGFHVPRRTQVLTHKSVLFQIRAYHALWRGFPSHFFYNTDFLLASGSTAPKQ